MTLKNAVDFFFLARYTSKAVERGSEKRALEAGAVLENDIGKREREQSDSES